MQGPSYSEGPCSVDARGTFSALAISFNRTFTWESARDRRQSYPCVSQQEGELLNAIAHKLRPDDQRYEVVAVYERRGAWCLFMTLVVGFPD